MLARSGAPRLTSLAIVQQPRRWSRYDADECGRKKPKPNMVRVYFTLLVVKTVTKQQIAMAVIER